MVLIAYLGGDQILRSLRERRVDNTLEEHRDTLDTHQTTLDQHSNDIEQNRHSITEEHVTNETQGQAIDELKSQTSVQQQDLEGLRKALDSLQSQLDTAHSNDEELRTEIERLRGGIQRLEQLEDRHRADRREIVDLQTALENLRKQQQANDDRLDRIEQELGIDPPPEPR